MHASKIFHNGAKKGLLQQNPVNKSQTENAGIKDFFIMYFRLT
jgi:hypothetical protein